MGTEKTTPENLGQSYLKKITESRPLTPEDEEAIANLLKRRGNLDEPEA